MKTKQTNNDNNKETMWQGKLRLKSQSGFISLPWLCERTDVRKKCFLAKWTSFLIEIEISSHQHIVLQWVFWCLYSITIFA